MKAKGGASKGFHVYHKRTTAIRIHGESQVIAVKVKGRVFGEDKRGMRVEYLYVPAKHRRRPAKRSRTSRR